MDLIDIINEKKFLGQEFLTWLWFRSEHNSGVFTLEPHTYAGVAFKGAMSLESGEGDTLDTVVCRGSQQNLSEARRGLAVGKKVEKALLHVMSGEENFHFTFRATMFEMVGLKIPKAVAGQSGMDDAEDSAGRLLDHQAAIKRCFDIMLSLYRQFYELRHGEGWAAEVKAIRNWIMTEAQTA